MGERNGTGEAPSAVVAGMAAAGAASGAADIAARTAGMAAGAAARVGVAAPVGEAGGCGFGAERCRSGGIAVRYFAQFALVLSIPLLLVVFFWHRTVNAVEGDYESAALSILEQSAQFCDQRFEEMDGIVRQLAGNRHVLRMKNEPDPYRYPKSYGVNETRENLINLEESNAFLLDYFILFNNSELVLNNRIAYSYDDFWSLYFRYDGMDYSLWRGKVKGGAYGNEVIGAADAMRAPGTQGTVAPAPPARVSVITYIRPLMSSDVKAGYIMFLVDNSEITRMLQRTDIRDGGFAFATDRAGSVISFVSSDAALDGAAIQAVSDRFAGMGAGMAEWTQGGRKMLVSHVLSPYNGFRYFSVQPARVVLAKLDYIKYSLLGFAAMAFGFGLALAVWLARRSARPIAELARNVGARYGRAEPFRAIRAAVDGLAVDNLELSRIIERQKPILREATVGRLLHGEFASDGEIVQAFSHAGIALDAEWYGVALFHCRGSILNTESQRPLDQSRLKATVREWLAGQPGAAALWLDIDQERMAAILCGEGRTSEEAGGGLRERLRGLDARLRGQGVFMAVGTAVRALREIAASYEQACASLNITVFRTGCDAGDAGDTGDHAGAGGMGGGCGAADGCDAGDTGDQAGAGGRSGAGGAGYRAGVRAAAGSAGRAGPSVAGSMAASAGHAHSACKCGPDVAGDAGGTAGAGAAAGESAAGGRREPAAPGDALMYYFPQRMRRQLSGAVRNGSGEAVRQTLSELFSKNILSMELPLGMQRIFQYDLLAFAAQLAEQISIERREYQSLLDTIDKIEKSGDLHRISLIYGLFVRLCDVVSLRLERQRTALIVNIEAFVRDRCAEPGMSLALISETFHINEAYLSHQFKQRTSQNFSVYLENLRMERAAELLAGSERLIQDIASEVGYLSANTFCRAFKRVFNINAMEYRRLAKIGVASAACAPRGAAGARESGAAGMADA
jgi:AraC-like DNA-binding protein